MSEPGSKYLFYRILGSINNLIAIVFLVNAGTSIFMAGINPTLILILFVVVALLIYTNLSLVFGRIVLKNNETMPLKLKDWIKVNAYVGIAFSVFMILLMLLTFLSLTFIPSSKEIINKLAVMNHVTISFIIGILIFMLCCAITFLIHIILTFKYLKRYKDHFV